MLYYRWHIGDFRKSTRSLSALERGIYRDLLDEFYDTEEPLPIDTEALCDALALKQAFEKKALTRVLLKKWIKTDKGYVQARAMAELHNQNEKRQKLSANGSLGGVAKHRQLLAEKLAIARRDSANGELSLASLVAISHQPSAKEPSAKEPAAAGVSFPDWAEQIRQAYCRDDSPMDCLQVILAELDHGTDPADMLAKVHACSAAIRKHAPGGAANRHAPRAKSFFTDRQWNEPLIFQHRWMMPEKKEGGGFSPHPPKRHPLDTEPAWDWPSVLRVLIERDGLVVGDIESLSWRAIPGDVRESVVKLHEETEKV